MAVTTGICWAILAIALKYALNFASSGTIVWVRQVVAFVLLGGYLIYRNRQNTRILWKAPLMGVLAGLGLAANYYGFMKCIELTGASNAQIMIQMAPMLLLITGIVYFKEKPSCLQWLGIAIAGTGFAFFYWDQILLAVTHRADYIQGNLWVAFAAVTWAYFAAVQKILIRVWTPAQFNLLMYAIAVVTLLPLAESSELVQLSTWQYLFLVALGVNTVVAYGALGEALKRIPASHVSLIISVNPLLTLLLLALMAHFHWDWVTPEPINWRGYLGAFLVVSGVTTCVAQRPSKAKGSQDLGLE